MKSIDDEFFGKAFLACAIMSIVGICGTIALSYGAPSAENADTEFSIIEEIKVKAMLGNKTVLLTLPKGCRIKVLAIRTKDDVLACR